MILLTGGTGFVGSSVAHALRSHERPVRCLVRKPGRAGRLESWGCELVQGDMTDAESLRRAVEGCDTVVHLVAIITGSEADFERVMAEGTRSLVVAAADAGVQRFVLASALGLSEQTRELVPYYRAKWDMEQAVQGSGIEHVILRPSFVFGRDGGVLPLFVRQVRWSPVTPVIGSGKHRLQPIWIDDVAACYAAAIEAPAAANRTLDLTGPDAVTWNELYARIARALGKRRTRLHVPVSLARAGAAVLEHVPSPPLTRDQVTMLEAGDNVADPAPAEEALGITPISLDEQLRRAT